MIVTAYQPCAYLLEGVEASALHRDGLAFQHHLALGLNRLTPAVEPLNLDVWLRRCLALRLRPVLLLSSYDSPLARQYRTYCRQFDNVSNRIQWLVWPPEPEEMTQVVRDPDREIIAAWLAHRNTDRLGATALTPKLRRAVWHESLIQRLASWLQDFGDLLPVSIAPADSSIAAISNSLDAFLAGSPRVVREERLKQGLAASSGKNIEPVTLEVGSWTISRQEIRDDPENQFLIFRADDEVVQDFVGRRVEVELGGQRFELGVIDERGKAEVLIPRGLDFKLTIDIRIIDGEGDNFDQ